VSLAHKAAGTPFPHRRAATSHIVPVLHSSLAHLKNLVDLHASPDIANTSFKQLIMTHDHDGAQASRLLSRDWYLATDFGSLSVQTSLLTPLADSAVMENSPPDPDFNEYGNRQSAKVNAGLDFGGPTRNHDEEEMTGATATNPHMTKNAPVVDVEISTLDIPATTALPTAPTTEDLVRVLLRPPPHAFPHGVLSFQWVMGAIGQSHFDFRASDERYVLRPESELRLQGQRLGLPKVYFEWLCGDEEGASPTEQGMLLKENFFDETRKEMEGDTDEMEVGQ
jgi:hypothetical protein